jgi:GNAT superfamily N-acetyltransferase
MAGILGTHGDLTFLEAGLRHAQALAEVQVRSWRAAYRDLIPARALDALSIPGRTDCWRRLLADGSLTTLVAQAPEGGVVGFINLGPWRDEGPADSGGRLLEVRAFYLLPERWRQGAGRRLLDLALAGRDWRPYRNVGLWVLDGNRRAMAFYEAQGFRRDGGVKVEPGPAGSALRELRYLKPLP